MGLEPTATAEPLLCRDSGLNALSCGQGVKTENFNLPVTGLSLNRPPSSFREMYFLFLLTAKLIFGIFSTRLIDFFLAAHSNWHINLKTHIKFKNAKLHFLNAP
jgi:hypothetical protein